MTSKSDIIATCVVVAGLGTVSGLWLFQRSSSTPTSLPSDSQISGPVSQTISKPFWELGNGRLEQKIGNISLVLTCRQDDTDVEATIHLSQDLSRSFPGDYAARLAPVIVRLDNRSPHWEYWRYRAAAAGHESARGDSYISGEPAFLFTDLRRSEMVGGNSLDPNILSSTSFYVAIDPTNDDTAEVLLHEPSVGYVKFDVADLTDKLMQVGCPVARIQHSLHNSTEEELPNKPTDGETTEPTNK